MLIRQYNRRRYLSPCMAVFCLIMLLLQACSTTGLGENNPSEPLGTDVVIPYADLPRSDLLFYLPGSSQPDQRLVNQAINDILLEKLNCTLEIVVSDWNLWDSKYPLLLSSGEQVDLIFTASYYGYLQEVSKNTFLPLDDLMAQFGQEIPGVMLDGYLEAARVKGTLYGIPVNKDTGQGWGIVANKEMAEEIGVDFSEVRYLEDLAPILRRAKESLKPEVVPLFLSSELSMAQISGSTEAASLIGLTDRSRFVQMENGIFYDNELEQAVISYQIPEMVSQHRLVRSWFLSGYMNTDLMTTQTTGREAMSKGHAFMHVQAQSPIHHKQWENETGKALISVEFLTGIKETQSMTGALTALPRACSDPERAMMVINEFMVDKELKNLFTWGIEGKHYELVEEPVIRLPEGAKNAGETGYNPGNFWHFGNAYLLRVWENEDPDKWDLLRDYCDVMPKSPLLGFSFDSGPVKLEAAAHANVMMELHTLLINGAVDTDDMLERLRQRDALAGVDRVLAEINRQVAQWKLDQVQP